MSIPLAGLSFLPAAGWRASKPTGPPALHSVAAVSKCSCSESVPSLLLVYTESTLELQVGVDGL